MGARASRPKPYPHPDNGGSFASVVPSGFVHHPDLCHSPTSCDRTSSPSHLWTPPPQLIPVASPGRLPDTTAAQHIIESMDATLPLPRVGRLRAKLPAVWCICVLFCPPCLELPNRGVCARDWMRLRARPPRICCVGACRSPWLHPRVSVITGPKPPKRRFWRPRRRRALSVAAPTARPRR